MGKKLIEVALPLEAVNEAAKGEKFNPFIRNHPRSFHQYWARRPLTSARAIIFSQIVDDPSEYLNDAKEIERERLRLLGLVASLAKWESMTNDETMGLARAEIRRSWARRCLGAARTHNLTDDEINEKIKAGIIEDLPPFHDPFAGGGSLPLEAQRLGLEAYASDLNPLAVLINKAMIEIPAVFTGRPPMNPKARVEQLGTHSWAGLQGLAEDVQYYGQWIRKEALARIGQLYPTIKVTKELIQDRRDLQAYVGRELTPIAWIWARTVRSPNPAFAHLHVPLISTYVLSSKPRKEVWLEPVVEGKEYSFKIRTGKPPASAICGTKLGRGAIFKCLLSGTPMESEYIKSEGVAGRMGTTLLAIVCHGDRGRIYFPALLEHQQIAEQVVPEWGPGQELNYDPRNIWTPPYGLTRYRDLFTNRQLKVLTLLSDLIVEARALAVEDAKITCDNGVNAKDSLRDAEDYGNAIALYLALATSRWTDNSNSIASWNSANENIRVCFTRQVLPMSWDFAELSPFGGMGEWYDMVTNSCGILARMLPVSAGHACSASAIKQEISRNKIISTDPPYYDNICYADLSDFFYVWLRRSLRTVYPLLFDTLSVPKTEELVASPYRHGGRKQAEEFFMSGISEAIAVLAEQAHADFPITIYYAFKQSEKKGEGVVSTGWETFLEAILKAGLTITATWPIRTEKTTGTKAGVNALASSIVLACRKRSDGADRTTRREFQNRIRRELPGALYILQSESIAPVDLAQSAIGPGMAIFSSYTQVVEPDGNPMKVATALALINETLDEILAEQEGELDVDSRWAVAWLSEYGTGEGPFGRAQDLSRAKNTSVEGLQRAGIVYAKAGKVNLLRREEMTADWDPAADSRLTVWEAVQHLILKLEVEGEPAAATLLAKLGSVAEQARDLAYRLYNTCERKGWADEARSYNGLVIAWPELARLAAQEPSRPGVAQDELKL